jgi:hypothetical protein
MKLIFRKDIQEKIIAMIEEHHTRKNNIPNIESISLTKNESLELWNSVNAKLVYPYKLCYYKSDIEKIAEIHNSAFMGYKLLVEGF